MFPSWLQIAIVVLLLVLLFGRGKISELMGDVARGIKSFKRGMSEDDSVAANAGDKKIETAKSEVVADKVVAEKDGAAKS